MSKLKYALFDMDGLMIDSERTCYDAWKIALKPYGIDIDEAEYVTYTGHRYDEIQQMFRANHPDFHDFEKFDVEHNILFFEAIDRGVPMKPGLLELMDALEEKEIEKVIVSSSSNDHVHRVLDRHNVIPRFKGIVGGQMVKRSKPNPDIFLLACETYGVKPEECLVFEDSIAGVEASHAAGIPVICVPDMKPLPDDHVGLCYAICPTLADAIPLLEDFE